jgi:hypothetical protein
MLLPAMASTLAGNFALLVDYQSNRRAECADACNSDWVLGLLEDRRPADGNNNRHRDSLALTLPLVGAYVSHVPQVVLFWLNSISAVGR